MATVGSVWAAGSWSTSAWAAGTWADASTVVVVGGQSVNVITNGVLTLPANSTTAAQYHWMTVQGVIYKPTLIVTDRPVAPRSRD